jgi:hypothetical protein
MKFLNVLLNSGPGRGEWSAARPGRFTPEERTLGCNLKAVWEGPGACLKALGTGKTLCPRIILDSSAVWPGARRTN